MLRTKRTKCIAVAAALLAALLIVVVLMLGWYGTAERSDFNRYSDAEVSLGGVAENLSEYEAVPGTMGGHTYQCRNGAVFFTVAGFPDVGFGGARVRSIRLCADGGNAHILGMRIGDNAEAVYRALEEHGYGVTHSSATGIRAERGRITLRIALDENGRVTELLAQLSATNLLRVQFKG